MERLAGKVPGHAQKKVGDMPTLRRGEGERHYEGKRREPQKQGKSSIFS